MNYIHLNTFKLMIYKNIKFEKISKSEQQLQSLSLIGINYDNVIICLYWKDVLSGESKFYLNKGYKVVTAGNINDINFLNYKKK